MSEEGFDKGEENKEEIIFSDEEVTELLKNALKQNIRERRKLPNRIELANALKASISEFMTCYKLVGYDLDGRLVNFTVYTNDIEKSAITNAVIEELAKYMGQKSSEL